MRTANLKRTTKETDIYMDLNIDGNGQSSIETTLPFLNHMLDAFSFYSGFDLTIKASGDLEIDDHHLVEDLGIVLGQVFLKALDNRKGIQRFSYQYVPMDESLSRVVIDISNRPVLVYSADYKRQQINNLSLENIKEFLYAFAMEARITLHASVLYGDNDHHKVESLFKAFGMAMKQAAQIVSTTVTSTKGVL
jgi:imidazoleglycerol-phosphate dehydratase